MKTVVSQYKEEDCNWGSKRTLHSKVHWILEQFKVNEIGRGNNGG